MDIKNKKSSLFIGRWQPLHDGHKKLITSVLEEGKSVVIGIRNTDKSKENPYSIKEIKQMFFDTFGNKVSTFTVPDIDEICYGRKVGYKIREINLDEKTKGISATKIREGKIWWITGNSGAGKTTLAMQFKNAILLDGDDMRECWTLGFSKDDRWEQNMRVAKLANLLRNQGYNVVVSTICPYKKLREEIKKMINCKFIYVEGGLSPSYLYPYEY